MTQHRPGSHTSDRDLASLSEGHPRTAHDPGREDETLAHVLGRIARDLTADNDLDETLDAIVAAAVQTIPGAENGGISEVRGGGRGPMIEPCYTSDPLIAEIDLAQTETGQGPCLEAAHKHEVVRVDDIGTDTRWPQFMARAGDLGVGSMLSLRLYVHSDNLGSLTLLATKPHAFDDEGEQIGLLFATHAAIAMWGVRREGQLRTAIGSRDLIGQAKGILMERYKLNADQAFAVLTRASTNTNRKLVEIAQALTATRELPGQMHQS